MDPGQSFGFGLLMWGLSQGFGCLGSRGDERGQPVVLNERPRQSVCRWSPQFCGLLLSWRTCVLSLTELHHASITGMSASSLILPWSGPVDLAPCLDWDLPCCWGLAECSRDSHPTPSAQPAPHLWSVRLLPCQPCIAPGSQLPFPAEHPALVAPWQPETEKRKFLPPKMSLSHLFAGCCSRIP